MKISILSTLIALGLITSSAIAAPLLLQTDACSSKDVCLFIKTDASIPQLITVKAHFEAVSFGIKHTDDESYPVSGNAPKVIADKASDLNWRYVTELGVTLTTVADQPISDCSLNLKTKNWTPEHHTLLISKTTTGYQCSVN